MEQRKTVIPKRMKNSKRMQERKRIVHPKRIVDRKRIEKRSLTSVRRILIPSGIIRKGKQDRSGEWRLLRSSRLPLKSCKASFTIEAAILVPLVLAVIFLLLQMTLYLHDSVYASAWLHEQAWSARLEAESGRMPEYTQNTQDTQTTVLRYVDGGTHVNGRVCRAEAGYEICLLPRFAALIFTGQPERRQMQVTEKAMDTPAFLKIAGAILEEIRE